jgi:hypothetical protein
MSFKTYVEKLDEGQLDNLIKIANAQLKKIKSKGRVRIFGVFGGKDGSNWFFLEGDARDGYLIAAKESLDTKYPEVSIEKRMVNVEELNQYITDEEKIAEFLASNPKIV